MRCVVMSDLHLSKKPWQVHNALKMCEGADAVLLAGDLTNDGTPAQMSLMHKCISEILPATPVFAVAGNHDYPHQPSPMIREGICDFETLQDWLLQRQPYPYVLDDSGAWAVRIGEIEIIGLNCVWHWRRFKFKDGAQLKWLEKHLETSNGAWHIILCHAPLLAHNPKRSDTKPYLSRDDQLQQILDTNDHIIFISGHTHVSMESPTGCVEYDEVRKNIYINDGSIRPTTVLTADGLPKTEPSDGNIVKVLIEDRQITVTTFSTKTSQSLGNGQLCFCDGETIQVFGAKK